MATDDNKKNERRDDLAAHAEAGHTNILREFWDYLMENKAWWLAPIVAVLLLVGGLLLLSGTAAAPFIYTLF